MDPYGIWNDTTTAANSSSDGDDRDAESKSKRERILETSALLAAMVAYIFASIVLRGRHGRHPSCIDHHFIDCVRSNVLKILSCKCNEIRPFDYACYVLVPLVTLSNLLLLAAMETNGVLFSVNCVLNFLTWVYILLWFMGARETPPEETPIAPPVACAAINAATWYAAILMCAGFSETYAFPFQTSLWQLLIPAVMDTAVVYALHKLKTEQSASAVGTPEEPFAVCEEINSDDEEAQAQPATVVEIT